MLGLAGLPEGFFDAAGSFGFGDGGAQFALLLLEGDAADGEDGFFDFGGGGFGVVDGDEEAGEELLLLRVVDGGERVCAVGAIAEQGDDFSDVIADAAEVGGVLGEGVFCGDVRLIGVGRGEGHEEDLLGAGERVGMGGGDEVAALGGGFFELGAEEG